MGIFPHVLERCNGDSNSKSLICKSSYFSTKIDPVDYLSILIVNDSINNKHKDANFWISVLYDDICSRKSSLPQLASTKIKINRTKMFLLTSLQINTTKELRRGWKKNYPTMMTKYHQPSYYNQSRNKGYKINDPVQF